MLCAVAQPRSEESHGGLAPDVPCWHFTGDMSDQLYASEQDQLRDAAVKRIRAKRDFWRLLGIFAIVTGILTAIWAMSGGGYYWPMWALFGMGIALAFSGLGAYGPASGPPSEERIAEEMDRMR